MKDAFEDIDDWQETPKHLLEHDIQDPSVEKARRHGWWARKFSATPGRTSVPDYIFAKYGCVFFDEFKKPGGTATDLQADEHKLMRDAGLIVYVSDTREHFDEVLRIENERAEQFRWLYE